MWKEVNADEFRQKIAEIPYKTSFILGQKEVLYEGKGRKFKNAVFAKQSGGKYFVFVLQISSKK